MADYNRRIAAKIQGEREKLGLSQTELAAKVGAESRTVRRWENGTSTPQPRHLRALAKAFRVGIEEIRPSAEVEEQAVLAQLDRIEKMVEELVRQAGLRPPPAKKGGLPKTPIRRRTGRPKKQREA